MEYTIPKFIDEKPKIVGPLTFQQFLFFAGALSIIAVLYFTVPLPLFIILAILLLAGATCLVFVKIEGHSVPDLIKNYFIFSSSSKVYLWKKRAAMPYKMMKMKKIVKKQKKQKQGSPIKIGGESNLDQVVNRLDFGKK